MVSFDTVFPADAVEFCPHPVAHDILVCGTYKLNETVGQEVGFQRRKGECLVFQLDAADDRSLRLIQSLQLPAIPDMKWFLFHDEACNSHDISLRRCHGSLSTRPVLGVADSEGSVRLYSWERQEKHLEFRQMIRCASAETLCLSIDWSSRRSFGSGLGSLAISLSNGSLCLLSQDDNQHLSPTRSWHAHDNEPWTVAWDYWNTNLLYSGGDDLTMKVWDIREHCSRPVFTNKRFNAGVTSIQNHPHIEHVSAVGSYDNTIRLFDDRKPLIPITDIDVGGGVWRLKWHPVSERKDDLLVACMHDGVKIIRLDWSSGTIQVIKRFDEHESMAYGADWSFDVPRGDTTVASCSFYDHVLHIWSG